MSEESDTSEIINEEDIFTILVATDIHLGFEEKDPIRDQDTFDTFEEILQIAQAQEVDLILLGGDLFHHAHPSPYCMYKCTELLKKYCLGDRPVEIEFLSDPKRNFNTLDTPTVNYEDPNLNVSIPVFSIHGNHDDPIGQKQVSAMDLLATTGLVNYFGRWNCYDLVEIEPILLRKGQTKLALYGLSHIKDERLGRLFLDKKVKMLIPDNDKDWFNLLVWHQNRVTRGVKNFIPDDTLPKFLDLVIWGHEHECRIASEKKASGVCISQPGRVERVSNKPLIRLNVMYKDEKQVFNAIRFGQTYIGEVANPEDMVKCQAIKEPVRRKHRDGVDILDVPEILADRVEDIVLQHFSENDSLVCFPVDPINEAVKKYIDSHDAEAPILMSEHLIKETIEKLEESMPEVEEVDKFVNDLKNSRQKNSANFVQKVLNDTNRQKKRNLSSEQEHDGDNDIVKISDDSSEEEASTSSKPRTGRGSRDGRGASTSRSSSSGKGSRGPKRGRGRVK